MSPRPDRALVGAHDIALAERCIAYRKATKMPQWVLGELCKVTQVDIGDIEHMREVPLEIKTRVRTYLAEAPRVRRRGGLRAVSHGVQNVYLTKKLLTWASLTNMASPETVEAVRALRDAYERAKEQQGLSSIPLIQLEVENALTLATRGRYRSERRHLR